MLVRPDDGGVDQRVFVIRIIGQGLEKTLPNPVRSPARKALANRATERLNGIPRSPPRRTGGCQARCCGQPYRGAPAEESQSAQIGRRAIHSASSQSLLKEGSL